MDSIQLTMGILLFLATIIIQMHSFQQPVPHSMPSQPQECPCPKNGSQKAPQDLVIPTDSPMTVFCTALYQHVQNQEPINLN